MRGTVSSHTRIFLTRRRFRHRPSAVANCGCFQQKTPTNYSFSAVKDVEAHRRLRSAADCHCEQQRLDAVISGYSSASSLRSARIHNPVGPPSTSCAHSAGCTRNRQSRSFPEFPCRRVGPATEASSTASHSSLLVEPDTFCGLNLADHRGTCGLSNLLIASTIGDGSGGIERLERSHEAVDGFVHFGLVLRCAARVIVS